MSDALLLEKVGGKNSNEEIFYIFYFIRFFCVITGILFIEVERGHDPACTEKKAGTHTSSQAVIHFFTQRTI